MSRSHRAVPWAVATVGLLCTVAILPGQGKNPALTGTWKLNPEKTKEFAENRISDRPTFTRDDGLRGSGRAARAAAGGVGGAGATGERAELGPLGLYARPLPELVIAQTDSSFTITDPRGTPRTYRTDGRKELEPLIGADSLEIVAKWKDGKLTTDRKLGSFGTIRTVYSFDAAAKLLNVDLKLSGPGIVPPVEMRWIYDLVPGS